MPAQAARRELRNSERITPLTVVKRDGTEALFDRDKICRAIIRCLTLSCSMPNNGPTRQIAETVANSVENLLLFQEPPITVEKVQDLVELQLMASGQHEAAKQYILFRESRRQQRENNPVDDAAVEAFKADEPYFRTDLERFQHFDKYAKYNDNLKRRETFTETIDRIMTFLQEHVSETCPDADISEQEWAELRTAILRGEATTSMRLMQMAGAAAQRCNVAIYNCAFVAITDIEHFAEGLYILMQGTGLGFSVESEFVGQLPRIKRQKKDQQPETYVVQDSTEGWCNSLTAGLTAWFDGRDIEYDYSEVRPEGARLHTKGGTASGPGPLRRLHEFARKKILSRQKSRLLPIDVHDIMCLIGDIVQVGGVRRAACISLSDLDDMEMRLAKHGAFWNDPDKRQRTMSNNSAVYEEKPSPEVFMREWLALIESKSGERGIYNRGGLWKQIPERRRATLKAKYGHQSNLLGINPCGEIILSWLGQFCNLSIAIIRPTDDVATLKRKARLAAIFGTIQSSMINFRYLRPQWRANCELEHLLGVDLLGAEDCYLLRSDNKERDELLASLKQVVLDTNVEWAAKLGIGVSTATTCIKPGGNSSVRWGTGQSMSGWLTTHMIRNVEVGKNNALHQFLVDAGVPHETSYRGAGTSVFSWPLKAPDGAQVVADLVVKVNADGTESVVATKPRRSAIHQLEDWRAFKVNWTEHNPSVTIYVADNEWLDVGHWVYNNWDVIGGLSFLPLDGGIYPQAPYTPITERQYNEFVAKFPKIEWSKLPRYELQDTTSQSREFACTGDKCTI